MKTSDYDEYELSEIINFIAQEIYVLAVKHSHTSEYELINQLAVDIRKGLHAIKNELQNESTHEEITEIMVNNIATDVKNENLYEKINDHIDYLYPLDEDNDNDNDNDYIKDIEILKRKIISCATEVCNKYSDMRFNLKYHYPPYVFCLDNDYLLALIYFYNKEYLPKRKEFKDGSEITHTISPYKTTRRYGYSKYRTRYIQNDVEVPQETLKKTMNSGEFKLELTDEKDPLIQEYFLLYGLRDFERVSYTNELRINIDTSSPLDDFEVDKILTMIRCEISNLQRDNKYSEYLMAKDINDFKRAFEIPDIKTENHLNIKKLHTPQIESLKTDLNAKNYLCGMIILNHYLFDNGKPKHSLDKLCATLSSELIDTLKIDDSKFSPDTILRGYKQVKKAFQNQIENINRFES
ncbi:TPA: hypothetical protein PXJ50_000349 [Yersinia enterocolitica]|nr:hypothetical protein [Yersinia enterocolitica]EKN4744905.1 hypothetical protein [Yersinia enterocolitica]EKN6267849.1 hypothetical protein [Yersinia enterocolitica]HDL6528674.1 hypothetical protein [Yersinia enterocolitica]HDL6666983.1 hypothetical protein [Yersinia enterocolitica]